MKTLNISVFLMLCTNFLMAQESYWQQEVNYDIEVSLDDEKHELHAFEQVEYINNSPDQLDFIWFHLWPNAYKNNKTAFAKQQVEAGGSRFYFADEEERGYIDSLDFKANGRSLNFEYHEQHPDIAKVYLTEPLAPGERVLITTPFKVKIPSSFSRLGHIKNQYQITQWYPKPAVYDQEGWHEMPYLDQGEFYSEFGRFDVKITLPETYVVGATGNLQTESEQHFLDSLASIDKQYLLEEDKKDENELENDNSKQKNRKLKTIRYTQENIHDFAWFTDQTYQVLKGEVKLPESERKVTLYALVNKQNYKVWKNVISYMEDAVYYYSDWVGEYPYDVVTTVDGALSAGAGMEYPTITVLGATDAFSLDLVTTHEIGHNWFYGILGSNERKHAWMDEGVNSLYEKRYVETKYPEKKLADIVGLGEDDGFGSWLAKTTRINTLPYSRIYEILYLVNARRNLDEALSLGAKEFTPINYGTMVYMKAAMALNHLEEFLGQGEFDRIMKLYYKKWQFKHPQPEDLKSIFETETGKNLDWVFDALLKNTKKVDYKISSFKKTADGVSISLKNKGQIASPVPIVALAGQDTVINNFEEGFSDRETIELGNNNIDQVFIDPHYNTLDLYRNDNRLNLNKTFSKSTPLEFVPIGGLSVDGHRRLYFMPTIGANTRDKFMLGAAFYNNVLPEQKFNYIIMPMYSFGLNTVSGSAQINYAIYPSTAFQKITFGASAKRYAGFQKLEPKLTFNLNPKSLRTSPTQRLQLKFSALEVDTDLLPVYEEEYQIISANYSISGGNAINRYAFNSELQLNPENFTLWQNSARFRHQYKRGKFASINVFYGQFLNSDQVHPSFLLGMSGSTDYLMERAFLDRAQISNTFTAFEHQTDLEQGGFRAFIPGAVSDSWLASANGEIDLPFVKVISLYGDIGWTPDQMYYGTGLKLDLLNNTFALYLPLIGSNYDAIESFTGFRDQIRFSLNLNQINPFNLIDDFGR